jgi:hypothetical protein
LKVTAAKQSSTDFATAVLSATEESIKQAQDLFESAFGQARQFSDSMADATLVSVKRNQLLANQAIGSLASAVSKGLDGSLWSLPRFDARDSVAAGFELAQTMIDAQRELAERLVGSVAKPAAV